MAEKYKKPRANPVYITPIVRTEYRDDDSSDSLPEGDDEYKPGGKKKQKRVKRKADTDDESYEAPKRKKKSNSVQDMLAKLEKFAKNTASKGKNEQHSDDDSHLTCPVCMTSYWYTSELREHMRRDHGMANIDK